MIQTLSNDILTVAASTSGAELQSIRNNRTGYEYLWQGDPTFWKRRSPVLFPIVGAVWNGVFRMDGREYPMGQHGFSRDTEFEIAAEAPEDEMWFSLTASDATLALYPRKFRLDVGYSLLQERIAVMWRVTNLDDKDMYFQIGAHPAFNIPGFNASDTVRGYLGFDTGEIISRTIAEKGCMGPALRKIEITDGLMPLTADTFAKDAIAATKGRIRRVSLLTRDLAPVLSVLFSSPCVGVWAPKPDAPFVCIEPWYGLADEAGFTGDFSAKAAVNRLAPGETFKASHTIIIESV